MDQIKLLKMFTTFNEITIDKTKDLKKWIGRQEKLIFLTNGIIKPDNWTTLPDKEKQKRITKLLDVIK